MVQNLCTLDDEWLDDLLQARELVDASSSVYSLQFTAYSLQFKAYII